MTPGIISVESLMLFGIGFLTACLFAVMAIAAVHGRAVRLTRRKYEIMPASMHEIRAERDQMRAGFAISTRALETSIAGLRDKTAAYARELVRKNDIVSRVQAALEERTAELRQIEARESATQERTSSLYDELHAVKTQLADRNEALREADSRVAAMTAEIASLATALERRVRIYDTQQNEITSLTEDNNALRAQIASLLRHIRDDAHGLNGYRHNGAGERRRSPRAEEPALQTQPSIPAMPRPVSAPRIASPGTQFESINDALRALYDEREGGAPNGR